jgi:hypothetical protein
LAIGGQET